MLLILVAVSFLVGFLFQPVVRRLLSMAGDAERKFWSPICIGFGATIIFFGMTFLYSDNVEGKVQFVAQFDIIGGMIFLIIGFSLLPRFKQRK